MNNYQFPKNKKVRYSKYSEIISTGSYFPQNIVTNDQLIKENNIKVTDNIIRKTIGTESRHIAEKGMTDSDVLLKAAEVCLKKAKIKTEQLSKLIVTKFLGDRILPMTASIVQRKLGSNNAFHAIDIDGGINSFMHSLDLSTRYISSTQDEEQYILLLSGGVNNITINNVDPRLAFLFGDGAGAILIKNSKENHFLASYQFSNFNHYDYAGSRNLIFDETVSKAIFAEEQYSLLYDLYVLNNWKENKKFYLEALNHTKQSLLEQSQLSFDEIDLVLITENNKQMHNIALETLDIPDEKTISIIEKYGNTMSGMLPIMIDEGMNSGKIKKGMNIMLLSYGEGISGGGVIYRV